MRVGLDVFTIRNYKLNPIQTLDFIKEHGLEGAQFGTLKGLSPKLDLGELKEIKAHADALGLYMHVSVSCANPHAVSDLEQHTSTLKREIELCHALGFHDVHTTLGSEQDRLNGKAPWSKQLEDSTSYIRELAPHLREHGVRLSLEDHGDTTTFELVRIVEELGDDVVSICLDTANVLVNLEDPLAAARRAAPYVRLTHAKDAILYFGPTGLERQVRPAGLGSVPWSEVLGVLGEHYPELTLSIEDHKEMPYTPELVSYTLPIYDSEWLAHYPDLSPVELARLVQSAYEAEERIKRGEASPPNAYGVPWEDNGKERLRQSANHLKQVITQLALAS